MSEAPFYVGYQKKASPESAAFTRKVVVIILLLVLVSSGLIIAAQRVFHPVLFEFGITKSFEDNS